jgi:hypothetical protein
MDLLPSETISIILHYLDKYSLLNYDNSLMNKNTRYIFLDAIKYTCYHKMTICKWTSLRGIKSLTEFSDVMNLKYVSNMCKKLILYSRYKNGCSINTFQVINDNVEHLHIDINGSFLIFDKLKAKNMKTMVIIGVNYINLQVFTDINKYCPNLKTINIIMSNKAYSAVNISGLVNNDEINIKVCNPNN